MAAWVNKENENEQRFSHFLFAETSLFWNSEHKGYYFSVRQPQAQLRGEEDAGRCGQGQGRLRRLQTGVTLTYEQEGQSGEVTY